jgi:hypothetical protein
MIWPRRGQARIRNLGRRCQRGDTARPFHLRSIFVTLHILNPGSGSAQGRILVRPAGRGSSARRSDFDVAGLEAADLEASAVGAVVQGGEPLEEGEELDPAGRVERDAGLGGSGVQRGRWRDRSGRARPPSAATGPGWPGRRRQPPVTPGCGALRGPGAPGPAPAAGRPGRPPRPRGCRLAPSRR